MSWAAVCPAAGIWSTSSLSRPCGSTFAVNGTAWAWAPSAVIMAASSELRLGGLGDVDGAGVRALAGLPHLGDALGQHRAAGRVDLLEVEAEAPVALDPGLVEVLVLAEVELLRCRAGCRRSCRSAPA